MGDGLVEMERMAHEVSRICPTQIQVVGFDTGTGIPEHVDYRDLPYIWRKGHYRMNVDTVRRRLKNAELVLGDVTDTVPAFLSQLKNAAIGFVAFDLDFYSSSCAALRIFRGSRRIVPAPRAVYFDDVVGSDGQLHCEDVGELLAIEEFNRSSALAHRIRPIHGLASKRCMASSWAPNMLVCHRYNHSRYCDYIGIDPSDLVSPDQEDYVQLFSGQEWYGARILG